MKTIIKWILFVIGFCIYTPIILGGDEAADRWLDCVLCLVPEGSVYTIAAIAFGAIVSVMVGCAVMIVKTDIAPLFRRRG